MSWATASWGAASSATNEDYALLVLSNYARANPAAYGLSHPVAPPLIWNDGLALAARELSQQGTTSGWSNVIRRHYPNSAYVGANFTAGGELPQSIHKGFMIPPDGHTDQILTSFFVEFGAGIIEKPSLGAAWATETFGFNDFLVPPPIPAGCILPRVFATNIPRQLMVNFFDPSGHAPRAVRAVVGSTCVNLARMNGDPDHATYGAERTFTGSGCIPLVFEAVRSDGVVYRWPQSGAVLIGVGAGGSSCAERTTVAPTQTCDGQPVPAPTPKPSPTPTPGTGNGKGLSDVKVTVRPGADPSRGFVQISAAFSASPSFDPSAKKSRFALAYGAGESWSVSLPQLCGGVRCLKKSKNGTSFSGSYADGRRLTVSRKADGSWRLRFTGTRESLVGVDDGVVTLVIDLAGASLIDQGTGRLQGKSLLLP